MYQIGYRVGTAHNTTHNTNLPSTNNNNSNSSNSSVETYTPHAIYCSYQFYSCMPTRTEVMRLVNNGTGMCVLFVVRTFIFLYFSMYDDA